ncbi:hypothetical protein FVE85_8338 [Porphyridium purpureum]|uniref:RING-type domain-containing protein n=1 Tax=Porphyridium purpureum TaxID=35688 RepID=A0A5J4YKD0_PORPP|nr:hypothetical protein FVE85_8338 [Porphyridium purpureum]|eukprot:POR7015..scf244_11
MLFFIDRHTRPLLLLFSGITLLSLILSVLGWARFAGTNESPTQWLETTCVYVSGEAEYSDVRGFYRSAFVVSLANDELQALRYVSGVFNVTRDEALQYNDNFPPNTTHACFVSDKSEVFSTEPVAPPPSSSSDLVVAILFTVLFAVAGVCLLLVFVRHEKKLLQAQTQAVFSRVGSAGGQGVSISVSGGTDAERDLEAGMPVRTGSKKRRVKLSAHEISELLDSYAVDLPIEQDDTQGDDFLCVVCIEGIEHEHKRLVRLECGHMYHRNCLRGWMKRGAMNCCVCNRNYLRSHAAAAVHSEESVPSENGEANQREHAVPVRHGPCITYRVPAGLHSSRRPASMAVQTSMLALSTRDTHRSGTQLVSDVTQEKQTHVGILTRSEAESSDSMQDEDKIKCSYDVVPRRVVLFRMSRKFGYLRHASASESKLGSSCSTGAMVQQPHSPNHIPSIRRQTQDPPNRASHAVNPLALPFPCPAPISHRPRRRVRAVTPAASGALRYSVPLTLDVCGAFRVSALRAQGGRARKRGEKPPASAWDLCPRRSNCWKELRHEVQDLQVCSARNEGARCADDGAPGQAAFRGHAGSVRASGRVHAQ